jgi:uncharacterized metal-binding protein
MDFGILLDAETRIYSHRTKKYIQSHLVCLSVCARKERGVKMKKLANNSFGKLTGFEET